MSARTRRGLLATTGVALFTGCFGGGSDTNSNDQSGGGNEPTDTEPPDRDNDGVPDAEDEFPDNASLSEVVGTEEDTRQIREDEWYVYQYDFASTARISYQFTVREGPEMDVYLFSEEEYNAYENGERARFFSDGSVENDVGGEAETTVEPGTYRLVFDNTAYGAAAPPSNLNDDIVEVEFEITVAQ